MKKRNKIRFVPEKNTIGKLYWNENDENLEITGLLYDESGDGCSLIFRDISELKPKQQIFVKAGLLQPLPAEIRWIKEIYNGINLVGIKYLEKMK